ncbi:uncharacterized protein EDB93DRAFT_1167433 [Suillus bovinus]|uniref:uncharacterized protein n=1 Tax=Suillus bovinus TaxID=48563 RepID=UPI001B86A272|nr:uncharacterized protein EDB93DRAFT_1167433 [Suillus bovinus]KAG2137417.1 hypothetical protein EDB93DRAFT_1167433 [Suillus bovinus]
MASLISPACPFQTPGVLQQLLGVVRSRWTRLSEVLAGPMRGTGAFARRSFWMLFAILHKGLRSLLPHSSVKVVDSEAPSLDQDLDDLEENDGTLTLGLPDISTSDLEAPSIKWLLETSTDPEVFLATAKFVPQVEWPLDIDTSDMLPQLYDIFTSCVDIQEHIVPSLEEKAWACAMALSHLYYGRVLQVYPGRGEFLGRERRDYGTFLDMWLILDRIRPADLTMLDTTIDLCSEDPHPFFSWLSHSLPYHFVAGRVNKDTENFATTVISKLLSSPSNQIVANCTLLACVMVGAQVDKKDIVRIDKRCHRLIW